MLLNLTPDQRGLIPELDAQRAKEVRRQGPGDLRDEPACGRAGGGQQRQPAGRAGPDKLTDGDLENVLATGGLERTGRAGLHAGEAGHYQPDHAPGEQPVPGQRIERFGVDAWIENGWLEIGSGTTVGYKRLLRLRSAVTTERLRIRIPEARRCADAG